MAGGKVVWYNLSGDRMQEAASIIDPNSQRLYWNIYLGLEKEWERFRNVELAKAQPEIQRVFNEAYKLIRYEAVLNFNQFNVQRRRENNVRGLGRARSPQGGDEQADRQGVR